MIASVAPSIGGFDRWFEIPTPGYTIFWVMPETSSDPERLIWSWIRSGLKDAEAFLAHCTRLDVEGFFDRLSSQDAGCASTLLSLGSDMHFLDSYSVRLDLFGGPVREYDGIDIRYVTDTASLRGPGSVSQTFAQLREECGLKRFIGFEDNLTDLALSMGERQHAYLFSQIVSSVRSRDGTIIGLADWYSHGEIYKANLIHLSDASILFGITSGSSKTKYLLPIKRRRAFPASAYEPKPYRVGEGSFQLLSTGPKTLHKPIPQENCYL